MAATITNDQSVTTGVTLLDRVKLASKNILDAEYLSALPKLRAAINGVVSDQVDPDGLTDESRASIAKLFGDIATALGGF